jgi:hypothetical protein
MTYLIRRRRLDLCLKSALSTENLMSAEMEFLDNLAKTLCYSQYLQLADLKKETMYSSQFLKILTKKRETLAYS